MVVVYAGNHLSDCLLSPQLELLAGTGLSGGGSTEISWWSDSVSDQAALFAFGL